MGKGHIWWRIAWSVHPHAASNSIPSMGFGPTLVSPVLEVTAQDENQVNALLEVGFRS